MKIFFVFVLIAGVNGDLGDVEIDIRIIGGQDASVGEFPYQVSLRFNGVHYCGGSVIDETTILTAGHCVHGKKVSLLSVAVGNNHLQGGEVHQVASYIEHRDYNPKTQENDIALLKLENPIQYNERVQPVTLGTQYIPAGVRSVASGWGVTVLPKFSDYLQKVKLLTSDLQECHDINAKQSSLPVKSTNLCTMTMVGEGTCIGDSGGPLVAHRFQIGIVSWGVGCAMGMPEVFTRVSSYTDWIDANRY